MAQQKQEEEHEQRSKRIILPSHRHGRTQVIYLFIYIYIERERVHYFHACVAFNKSWYKSSGDGIPGICPQWNLRSCKPNHSCGISRMYHETYGSVTRIASPVASVCSTVISACTNFNILNKLINETSV